MHDENWLLSLPLSGFKKLDSRDDDSFNRTNFFLFSVVAHLQFISI